MSSPYAGCALQEHLASAISDLHQRLLKTGIVHSQGGNHLHVLHKTTVKANTGAPKLLQETRLL